MPGVELGNYPPHLESDRVFREVLDPPTHDVAARVARSRVQPQQNCVGQQHEATQTHVATPVGGSAGFHERCHGVIREDRVEDETGVEEVTVDVLHYQREAGFTRIGLVRLGDRARRRGHPKSSVVGPPVVVAGHPEAEREDQDDDRRRYRPPRPENAQVGRHTGVAVG